MSEITVLADLQDACGEGPLWDERTQTLRWVDISNQRIHKYDWDAGRIETTAPGIPVSALALTENGALVASGAAGIWLIQDGTAPLLLAGSLEGKPLSINDSLADPRGRLLAGSTFFDGSDTYPLGSLYRLDRDGSLHILDEGFRLANGMGFSPDQRTLYVTDSAAREIYTYDYSPEAGTAINRRLFVQVPGDEGLPDGLTVDAEGFVWSAQWFGRCVCRYDPDGVLERRVPIPADQTSSVTFGGTGLDTLFVTSAGLRDAEMLAPPNYQNSSNIGGQLFRMKPGVTGKLEFRVRNNSF